MPEDPNEESPFGQLTADEIEEAFESSGVDKIKVRVASQGTLWGVSASHRRGFPRATCRSRHYRLRFGTSKANSQMYPSGLDERSIT